MYLGGFHPFVSSCSQTFLQWLLSSLYLVFKKIALFPGAVAGVHSHGFTEQKLLLVPLLE